MTYEEENQKLNESEVLMDGTERRYNPTLSTILKVNVHSIAQKSKLSKNIGLHRVWRNN